jgi:hypothetical protein
VIYLPAASDLYQTRLGSPFSNDEELGAPIFSPVESDSKCRGSQSQIHHLEVGRCGYDPEFRTAGPWAPDGHMSGGSSTSVARLPVVNLFPSSVSISSVEIQILLTMAA